MTPGRSAHDAPPAEAAAGYPGERGEAEARQVWAHLREQVVSRLRWMNTHHAQHAWDQRVRDPLAAHGLAFFAYEPAAEGGLVLRTATRLFLHGDAPYALPRLVYEFIQHAHACQQEGTDPIVQLTDRREPLGPQARFLGVGVSSLDSRWQPWTETQRKAGGVLEVPGRCVAVLNDGTAMVIDRGAREQFDRFTVYSTGDLQARDLLWGTGLDWRRAADPAELLGGTPPLAARDRHDLGEGLRLLDDLARLLGAGRP